MDHIIISPSKNFIAHIRLLVKGPTRDGPYTTKTQPSSTWISSPDSNHTLPPPQEIHQANNQSAESSTSLEFHKHSNKTDHQRALLPPVKARPRTLWCLYKRRCRYKRSEWAHSWRHKSLWCYGTGRRRLEPQTSRCDTPWIGSSIDRRWCSLAHSPSGCSRTGGWRRIRFRLAMFWLGGRCLNRESRCFGRLCLKRMLENCALLNSRCCVFNNF